MSAILTFNGAHRAMLPCPASGVLPVNGRVQGADSSPCLAYIAQVADQPGALPIPDYVIPTVATLAGLP